MSTGPVLGKTAWPDLFPVTKNSYGYGRAAIDLCRRYALAIFYGAVAVLMVLVYHGARHQAALFLDGEEQGTVETFSRTVEELLKEKGIELHPRDRVTPHRQTVLGRYNRIDIERAFEVTVVDGNRLVFVYTPAVSVQELLAREGFELGPYDRVEPADLKEVYDGAVIKVIRVQRQYACSRSEVPCEVRIEKNPLLDRGLSRIKNEGKAGLQEELVEITKENGAEVSRKVIGTALLKKPLAKIVERGTNTTLRRENRVMEFEKVFLATATAYCPGTPGSGCPLDKKGRSFCTGSYNNGYTATGKKAVQGQGTLASPRIVAVDPRLIPLGSLLYIEPVPGIGKIGFAKAEDVGGAIKGQRIDLLFDQHREVVKFGVRRGVKIYLLKGA